MQVFLVVLPTETAEPAPLTESVDAPCSAVAVLQPIAWVDHDISVEAPVPAEEEPTAEESNDSMGVDEADPLWGYVTACSTREATKCAEIRAALETKVGKVQAQKLLARAKPTVAQDPSGKKNRVLKLGGSLLKLK